MPPGPPPTPKPRPRKESTASHQQHMPPTQVPAQETEPPLKESCATTASDLLLAVRHGCPVPPVSLSPRPPVAVKPKHYRHMRQNGDSLAANTSNLPTIPTPTMAKRGIILILILCIFGAVYDTVCIKVLKRTHCYYDTSHDISTAFPILQTHCAHTIVPQDYSSTSGQAQQTGEVDYDYVDVTGSGTGDSGFAEPSQWKQHMSNPPPDRSKQKHVHSMNAIYRV